MSGLLTCSLRHYAIYPRFQTICRGTLLSTLSTIYDFPQNLRKFCFNFSRVECWLQEKLKTKLLQKFFEKKNCIMGKLKVELTDLQLELGLPGVSGGQVG